MMKFSEMPYTRPDPEAVKAGLQQLTERLRNADSYEAARAVFLEKEEKEKTVDTMGTLAYIRHSIDTRNEFYDGEIEFWDEIGPEIELNESSVTRPFPRCTSVGFSTQNCEARNSLSPRSEGASQMPAFSTDEALSNGTICARTALRRLDGAWSTTTPRAPVSVPCMKRFALFRP